jgi:predicted kinase
MPTVTLFCGLPGAGKTTLAKRLQAQGRGIRLCTDDWQAELGVPHADTAFHERLQPVLYRHALDLLRHGTDVILEDGLWRREERAEKFADARAAGARIELHIFDVDLETLWARLRQRNAGLDQGAYPMTRRELELAWSLFEPPDDHELAEVDASFVHHGGTGPTP